MNINLRKISVSLIILLLTSLVFLLLGCETVVYFDSSGNAVISIYTDRVYDNLAVSCSEGNVTKEENVYKINLNSRNTVDVIVFCEGYESAIINFLTCDLKSGFASRTITLKPLKRLIYAEILSEELITKVTAAADDESLIKKQQYKDNFLTIETTEIKSAEFTFTAEGYADNKISINESCYKNYCAYIKVPLSDNSYAAVTIKNDISTRNPVDLNFYEYNIKAYKTLMPGESSALINPLYNYAVTYENNKYLLSSAKIKQLCGSGKPYINIDFSDLCPAVNEDTVSVINDELLDNYIAEQNYNYVNTDIIGEKGNFWDGAVYSLKSGEEILIYIYGYTSYNEKETISLYRHTVTENEAVSKSITIYKKIDNLTASLTFKHAGTKEIINNACLQVYTYPGFTPITEYNDALNENERFIESCNLNEGVVTFNVNNILEISGRISFCGDMRPFAGDFDDISIYRTAEYEFLAESKFNLKIKFDIFSKIFFRYKVLNTVVV